MGHNMAVRRPLIHPQFQNIWLRCHGIRLPLARLHEKSSEGGGYIKPSFRRSLLCSSHPLFLSFTKKKKQTLHGVCCSSLLLKNDKFQQHGVHFYSFFVHYTQTGTKTLSWGRLCCFSASKNNCESRHGTSLAFLNDIINSKRLSALGTTPKLEKYALYPLSKLKKHYWRNITSVPLMFVLGFKTYTGLLMR